MLAGGNVRYAWAIADLTGIDRRIDPNNPAYQNLLHPNLDAPTENSRYQQIIGTYPDKTASHHLIISQSINSSWTLRSKFQQVVVES